MCGRIPCATSITRRFGIAVLRQRWHIVFGVLALSFASAPESRALPPEPTPEQLYVNASNPASEAPYLTWETAATNIDEAVQAAPPGSTIIVTNGEYRVGGRVAGFEMTRVVIDKPVRVESVHGPEVTIIRGEPGVRCAWIIDGAVLSGFTLLEGGASIGSGVYSPRSGEEWLASSALVTNCVLLRNRASGPGGGAYRGRYLNCKFQQNAADEAGGAAYALLQNCVLAENFATKQGGAALGCLLTNCTVTANRAGESAGGVAYGSLFNSIVYHNISPSNPNHSNLDECRFSCTTPLPQGEANLDLDPLLASTSHLTSQSPCVAAGSPRFTFGSDVDGNAWAALPSSGADQFAAGNLTGPVSVEISAEHSRFADGFVVGFAARIDGRVSHHIWDFGDGTTVTNQVYVTHSWNTPERYPVRLTAFNQTQPEGMSAVHEVEVVFGPVFHVNAASVTPAFPYDAWERAARTIQEAVDASVPGRRVLVAEGVYDSGGRKAESLLNRVVVDHPITIESIGGPEVTRISGGVDVRGVYLTAAAVLSGFTISGGSIQGKGGGVYCASTNFNSNSSFRSGAGALFNSGSNSNLPVLTNCILRGNSALTGGGVHGGALIKCRLQGNVAAHGGGAAAARLDECQVTENTANYGGGAVDSLLRRCVLMHNTARELRGGAGGGASNCDIHHCLIRGNTADHAGGGVIGGRLFECTVVENTAGGIWWLEPVGGGVANARVFNSIVYFNQCQDTTNRVNDNHYLSSLNFSCTRPLPSDNLNNIDANPGFVAPGSGDFHLLADSSCIDRGMLTGDSLATDLDGVPMPLDGNGDGMVRLDIGAYEFLLSTADSNGDGIEDGWTWRYGLNPAEPGIAGFDPDQDGVTTFDEWLADTNPLDAASRFRIERVVIGPPFAVVFPSSTNRVYRLYACDNLATPDAWQPVSGETDATGNGTWMSLTDTRMHPLSFYRVLVRRP